MVKSRPSRSGNRRPDWSGMVVFTRLRSRIPARPFSRITRATRLWLTRSPSGAFSFRSAVIRGAPDARSPPLLRVLQHPDPRSQRRVGL